MNAKELVRIFSWIFMSTSLTGVNSEICDLSVSGYCFWISRLAQTNNNKGETECMNNGNGSLATFDQQTWAVIYSALIKNDSSSQYWVGSSQWPAGCINPCCHTDGQNVVNSSCGTPKLYQLCMRQTDVTTQISEGVGTTVTEKSTTLEVITTTVVQTATERMTSLSSTTESSTYSEIMTTGPSSTNRKSTTEITFISVETTTETSTGKKFDSTISEGTIQSTKYLSTTTPNVPTTSATDNNSKTTTFGMPTTTVDDNSNLQEKRCSAPKDVANAGVDVLGFTTGSVAVYTCEPNYKVPEGGRSKSVLCISGSWEYDGIACIRRNSCETAVEQIEKYQIQKFPDNPTTTYSYSEEKRTLEIQCNGNNRLWNGVRQMTVSCDLISRQSLDDSICQAPRCEAVPYIAFSTLGQHTSDVNTTVTVTCQYGYHFVDGSLKKTFNCMENLSWNITADDVCREDTCPPLTIPANSEANTSRAVVGTLVQVTCNIGYMFPDLQIRRVVLCQFSQIWNETFADCKHITCPAPQILKNGETWRIDDPLPVGSDVKSYQNDTNYHKLDNSVIYYYGAAILYQCKPGTRLETGHVTKVSYCAGVGNWTLQYPSCEANRCPSLDSNPYLEFNTSLATEGVAVQVTCGEGYYLADRSITKVVKCNGTVWNDTNLSCQDIYCPHESEQNSVIVSKTGNAYNDTAIVVCKTGYKSKSSPVVMICDKRGHWSYASQSCEEILCYNPPKVIWSTQAFAKEKYRLGENVLYQCLNGYWHTRGVTAFNVTCSASGWSPAKPNCKAISCLPVPTWQGLTVNTTNNLPGAWVKISYPQYNNNSTVVTMTTYCDDVGNWNPPVDLSKIQNQTNHTEITPTEATSAGIIGTLSVGFVCAVASVCPIIDLTFLIAYLKTKYYDGVEHVFDDIN